MSKKFFATNLRLPFADSFSLPSRPGDETARHAFRQKSGGKRWKIISLFSGCGGMDLGFMGGFSFLDNYYAEHPFDIIWANELNLSACATYKMNLGDHIVNDDIANAIASMPREANAIIGGFPCQDISINGKMLGINGARSGLYSYMGEAVKRVSPEIFVAENVGGLLLKQNSYSLNKILEDFGSLGYRTNFKLYKAERYGVPQTRERVFIVGVKKGLPDFIPPLPAHSAPISAKEALADLEDREKDKKIAHIWSMAKASKEQGNRRLLADRPGYTIRAECHGNIQFHYSLPRRISMREAARLQSFPDSFIFPGGLRETERQIGNAVPPVLAWNIARSVKEALDANDAGRGRTNAGEDCKAQTAKI